MENEVNKGKCFRCNHFEKYYTRGVKSFKVCKIGWCCLFRDHKNVQDNCPFYILRRKRPVYKSSALIALNHIFTDISQLYEVLKDEIKENRGEW